MLDAAEVQPSSVIGPRKYLLYMSYKHRAESIFTLKDEDASAGNGHLKSLQAHQS